jgi:type II secretory pathway pseudopilin PulG
VEVAVAFCVLAGAAAALVPACMRSIRFARTAEAAENLRLLTEGAAQHLSTKGALASAPLTPANVPRGVLAEDPAGTWDHPTWKALGFELSDPHAYAYRLDVALDDATPLRVVAHGDLDGDGIVSTFQRTAVREGTRVVPTPGLLVTADLE